MPVQNTDLNTSWNITASDQTWTLTKNATISVENQNGIFENGFSGSEIRVLGDINVSGEVAAVRVTGAGTTVLIGADSRINAKNAELGVYSEEAPLDIVNRGFINVGDTAIVTSFAGALDNFGTIIGGDNGVYFTGQGSTIHNHGFIKSDGDAVEVEGPDFFLENDKGAEISGEVNAVALRGAGTSEIVNKGILHGGYSAITDGNGDLKVTNAGKIVGDIYLGDGQDLIDTRKGLVKGTIDGGYGSDTFVIADAKTKIIEDFDGTGTDEVRSTVSYKLAANVENLRLLGRNDTNGTGNDLSNTVAGNSGDNRLSGKAGVDYLNGGRGDDFLSGGTDADVFLFKRTDGGDVIKDFEDGMDRLYIEGVYNQASFDELDIRQANGDVIVDFGRGNEIRIEDMTKANFTFEDIILLA